MPKPRNVENETKKEESNLLGGSPVPSGSPSTITLPTTLTIATFVGGPWNNPTQIKTQGNVNWLVALLSQGTQGSTFQMQPNFQIGDRVEVHHDPQDMRAPIGMTILDENGNDMSPQYGNSGTVGRGCVYRKVYNGPGANWVIMF